MSTLAAFAISFVVSAVIVLTIVVLSQRKIYGPWIEDAMAMDVILELGARNVRLNIGSPRILRVGSGYVAEIPGPALMCPLGRYYVRFSGENYLVQRGSTLEAAIKKAFNRLQARR